MAPEFSHSKGNHVRFVKLVLMNVYPLHHSASFVSCINYLLSSYHLQKGEKRVVGKSQLLKLLELVMVVMVICVMIQLDDNDVLLTGVRGNML